MQWVEWISLVFQNSMTRYILDIFVIKKTRLRRICQANATYESSQFPWMGETLIHKTLQHHSPLPPRVPTWTHQTCIPEESCKQKKSYMSSIDVYPSLKQYHKANAIQNKEYTETHDISSLFSNLMGASVKLPSGFFMLEFIVIDLQCFTQFIARDPQATEKWVPLPDIKEQEEKEKGEMTHVQRGLFSTNSS